MVYPPLFSPNNKLLRSTNNLSVLEQTQTSQVELKKSEFLKNIFINKTCKCFTFRATAHGNKVGIFCNREKISIYLAIISLKSTLDCAFLILTR